MSVHVHVHVHIYTVVAVCLNTCICTEHQGHRYDVATFTRVACSIRTASSCLERHKSPDSFVSWSTIRPQHSDLVIVHGIDCSINSF